MSYQCTVDELKTLMECRGAEAKERIETDYGGIDGLCKKLRTDPLNGLPNTEEELEKRRQVFGRNEIPPPEPKGFLTLVWEVSWTVLFKFG